MSEPAAPADGFAATLADARLGDATAWSTLHHAVAPILIGYLRAQRLADPEDVAGEVLLEVVRGIQRFEGDERGFRSWVLAIAHHRMLDARRRAVRRPVDPVPTSDLEPHRGDDDPEATTLAHLALGELEPALDQLTEEQRTVLLLRVVGDLSITDVAAILGKRTGAVKQLQRRAVDAMRRALDREAAAGRHGEAAGGDTVEQRARRASTGGGRRTEPGPGDAHEPGRSVT